MHLDTVLANYLSLTHDAVAVGFRGPDDDNAVLVATNPAFETLFGHASDAVLGQPVDVLHDPEDWPDFVARVAPRFAAKETRIATEAKLLKACGTPFWASIGFFTVEAENGAGRYICATYRDISDLKAREAAANAALADRDRALREQRATLRALQAVQARLLNAMDTYPAPFVIYDRNLRLVTCNTAYRRSMAASTDDLKEGMHVSDVLRTAIAAGLLVLKGEEPEDFIARMLSPASLGKSVEDLEYAGDNHHRVIRSVAENGDIVIVRLDTTELVRQRRAAAAMQDRIVAAMTALPDPFAIFDRDHRLVVWNPPYEDSMTDPDRPLSAGMHLRDVLYRAVRAGKLGDAEDGREGWMRSTYSPDMLDPGVEDFECEGDRHYRAIRSRTEAGEHVILRLDLTEVVRQRRSLEEYARQLEAANQEITYKALHDDLTGLGNRRHLTRTFARLGARRAADGCDLAALHIDLDRFKQINDTIGHAAGDAVLIETAARIRRHVEPDDIVARIGGDEFVVLLEVPEGSDRPETLARALLADLGRPVVHDGKECRFGASIGLARTPLSDTEHLLTNSDVALYKAKRAGRGQIGIFDRTDLDEMRRAKALADDVLRAIEAEEFVPVYQPQVDLAGRIVAIEVLARWAHPRRGSLAPGVFLPIATDLNVVAEIDRMVFERAIADCQRAFGHDAHPPGLSFNVSSNRVQPAEMERIGQQSRAYSGGIAFELLETIFLEEERDAFLYQLDRLRELGISIEVDDFGSGRASVVALQRIAPDRLKIDRRLVAPIETSAGARRLLRSIVEIGNSLGIGVTAEGVETQAQADMLAAMGCDRFQGFHIAQPMDLPALRLFLEAAPPRTRSA